MGVLIRGMEMPQSCDDCRLNNGISCYAVPEYTEDGVVGRTDDRPYWCPLVPVQPHGRLIDADALEMERRAENAKKGWHDSFAVVFNGDPYYEAIYDCTEQFKKLVNNAPTIIPAEEGE